MLPDMTTLPNPVKKTLAGLAPPPPKAASFFKTLRASKGNAFEVVPMEAFEKPVYLAKSILGNVLMVNDPDGVRRVLLDNVANYPKTIWKSNSFPPCSVKGS